MLFRSLGGQRGFRSLVRLSVVNHTETAKELYARIDDLQSQLDNEKIFYKTLDTQNALLVKEIIRLRKLLTYHGIDSNKRIPND